MKKVLMSVVAACLLQVGLFAADTVMESLSADESLYWCWEGSKICISRGRTAETAITCYKPDDSIYTVRFSNGGKKAWFVNKENILSCLDGMSGELRTVGLIETPYVVSADGKRICFHEHRNRPVWENTRKEWAFVFTVLDAETGSVLGNVEWTLYNWGDEMELEQAAESGRVILKYMPAGLFYAEAELDLNTMELKVIRDDSHLEYDELPKIYKLDEHA